MSAVWRGPPGSSRSPGGFQKRGAPGYGRGRFYPSVAWAERRAAAGGGLDSPQREVLLQHPPEFLDVDVPLAAYQHEVAVVAEVAVPFDDLLVAPLPTVARQVFVGAFCEVGAQADAPVDIVRVLCRRRWGQGVQRGQM